MIGRIPLLISISFFVTCIHLALPAKEKAERDKDDEQVYAVITTSGRIHTGTIVKRNDTTLVLKTKDGNVSILLDEIEEIKPVKKKVKETSTTKRSVANL